MEVARRLRDWDIKVLLSGVQFAQAMTGLLAATLALALVGLWVWVRCTLLERATALRPEAIPRANLTRGGTSRLAICRIPLPFEAAPGDSPPIARTRARQSRGAPGPDPNPNPGPDPSPVTSG
jgi:hypothetical protein